MADRTFRKTRVGKVVSDKMDILASSWPLYPQERSGSCGLKVLLSHHLVVVGDAVYCLYIV